MDIIAYIGAPLADHVRNFVNFCMFVYETIDSLFRNIRHGKRLVLRITAFQIYFTAIQAVPILVLLSIFLFTAIIMQVDIFVPQIGAGIFLGKMFAILVIRELAPLVVAFVIIARSGTAIASELSTMVINDEVSQMKVLGIDPLYVIVIPRIIGITLSMICLSFMFSVITVYGGMMLSCWYLYVPTSQYLNGLFDSMTQYDVMVNILKSLLFGLVISFLCCFQGLSTKYSPTEIPQVTTRAVITSFFWCFVFSALITVFYY